MINIGQKLFDGLGREMIVSDINKDFFIAQRKIVTKVSCNDGKNAEVHEKNDNFCFKNEDIGIKVFFDKSDIKNRMLKSDNRYSFNKDNIVAHCTREDEEIMKRLHEDEPYGPILNSKLETKIISDYYSDDISFKQETEFYEKCGHGVDYFGRIDLNTHFYRKNFEDYLDNHYYDKIYITKGRYKDKGNGVHIVNWRAPIATLYYDNQCTTLTSKHYVDIFNKYLHGIEIGSEFNVYEYELLLKRNFSSLNPIKYTNTYIIGNEFYSEGSSDSFLMNVLIENRANHKITDIIKTIQSNQNKIIREEKDSNMIVQGCAGSGKTMILLHRLSYLKFNSKLPSLNKVKIITPNENFSTFIEDLSISLELEQIERITMFDYYISVVERYQSLYSTAIRKNVDGEDINTDEVKFNKKALDYFESGKICKDVDVGNILADYYTMNFFRDVKKEYDMAIKKVFDEISIDTVLSIANRLDKGIDKKDIISDKNYLDIIFSWCNFEFKNTSQKLQEQIDKQRDEIIRHNSYLLELGPLYEKVSTVKKSFDEILAEQKLQSLNVRINELEQNKQELAFYKIIQQRNLSKQIEEMNKERVYLETNYANRLTNEFLSKIIIEAHDLITSSSKFIGAGVSANKVLKNKVDGLCRLLLVHIKSLNVYESNFSKDKFLESLQVDECIKILEQIADLFKNEINRVLESIQTLNNEVIDKESKILNENELSCMQKAQSILNRRGLFVLELFEKIRNKYRDSNKDYSDYFIFGKQELVLLACIYYLHCNSLKNSESFLFVDEGQDYSLVEYNLLQMINGKNCILNIFGDINQCINKNSGITSWEELNNLLKSKYYILNENYRNSVEITDFTNDKFKLNSLPIGVHGPIVSTIVKENINGEIQKDIQDEKDIRIAIISNDEELILYFKNQIDKNDIFVGTALQAKGLEFDNVFAYLKNMNKNEQYIACTRALNKLTIIE